MDDNRLDSLAEEFASAPTFFREHAQFLDLLEKATKSAGDSASWTGEMAPADEQRTLREMSNILELYQERPTCLDPYLERIVGQLMSVVQEYVYAYHDSVAESAAKSAGSTDMVSCEASVGLSRLAGIFDLLYTLCKVRGYKVVMRFFPHGVADIEPVFTTLWMHSSHLARSGWTTRYMLLIWMSLLAMIPFDMESIDSGNLDLPSLDGSQSQSQSAISSNALVDRWIELGKFYLRRPACEMEGAAVMLSRLLSRKDTATAKQPAFIDWAIGEIRNAIGSGSDEDSALNKKGMSIASVLCVNGALRVLCHLLVAIDSAHVLRLQMPLLIEIFESNAYEQHSVTRKLIAKATQRLALLVLPPVTAANTARSSVRKSARANLGGASGRYSHDHLEYSGETTALDDNGDADSAEISEEVETFIGILLQKLQDKDTIVRWSAAKGIGRVAERLPPALAQEIVSAVADVLKEHALESSDKGIIDVSMTSEFAWHGALLALAELSRKGLLMPRSLRSFVPWVVRGLTYEIQRGDYSVGSNVRDAACYVMWSFARMPNPESRRVFGEMSLQMSTTLISVAVFDRESNVRRAASAAFQEHVGRHSSFPHGISVLQLADFFSVGNMRNAFVVASRKIAEYNEYREPLLRHLCMGTIYHWEHRTRELAAAALRELVPLAAPYVVESLLPQIVANTTSPFLAVRHGAIVAAGVIAEVLAAELKENDMNSKEVDGVVSDFSAFVRTYGITAEQHQQ
ncbi:hypothetical protein LPJ56_002398, partial [Coemansia sp. RSA 2599]